MEWFSDLMFHLITWCYQLSGDFGFAIVLFTFISKLILLPVSIWTYVNSIVMLRIQPDVNMLKVKYYGQKDMIAEEEAKLFKEKGYHPFISIIPTVLQFLLLAGVAGAIRKCIDDGVVNTMFFGIDLAAVPMTTGVHLLWSPLVSAMASLALCVAQNRSNVLQAEQSKVNQYGMLIFSVGLSLYLGWVVPLGTVLYWVCSNLMAIIQMYIMNGIIRPRRFIDYEKLEDSRKQLKSLQKVGMDKAQLSGARRREREDYKRFFSTTNKHLVFYSENNGFYKYFKGIIEVLLRKTKLTIHYITSDPDDRIFEMARDNQRIVPYYIGENKLISLMMKMDADVVCMTMPDLDNYHIKRSYVRRDIEYIHIPHAMDSYNMTTRKGSSDHFDTFFCAGPHQKAEMEESERVFGTQKKNNIAIGYPLLDEMIDQYKPGKQAEKQKVIVAPSWQPDNIIDSCLVPLLDELSKAQFDVIVRPHPQHVRHKGEWLKEMAEKYADSGIVFQLDFSSHDSVMTADALITDWSGIAFEYSFSTLHPTVFINTPMKVMNPEYELISVPPVNITLREEIGHSVNTDMLDQVVPTINEMFADMENWKKRIRNIRSATIYNLGCSSEIAADYIVKVIQEKIQKRTIERN